MVTSWFGYANIKNSEIGVLLGKKERKNHAGFILHKRFKVLLTIVNVRWKTHCFVSEISKYMFWWYNHWPGVRRKPSLVTHTFLHWCVSPCLCNFHILLCIVIYVQHNVDMLHCMVRFHVKKWVSYHWSYIPQEAFPPWSEHMPIIKDVHHQINFCETPPAPSYGAIPFNLCS